MKSKKAQLAEVMFAIEVKRLSSRGGLGEFCRGAWHVLEPGTELKWNFHLSAMCLYLESWAYRDNDLRRLILNIPPGSMKSLMVSVFLPAWMWTWDDSHRFINLTNEIGLATRDSRRMRDLIISDWFKARWPKVQLSSDQREKTNFENMNRGFRQGLGITGNISGKRGNCLVGETLVTTPFGEVCIKDIRVGDVVASVEDNCIVWNKVSARQFSKTEELYEVETISGSKIRLTGEHKIYCEKKGWIETSDVVRGDRVYRIEDLSDVRSRDNRESIMQNLLSQSTETGSDFEVRQLRGRIGKTILRIREIFKAWRKESVLQYGLLQGIQEKEHEKVSLYGLWHREVERWKEMSSLCCKGKFKKIKNFIKDYMLYLQHCFSASITPNSILWKRLLEQSSLITNDGKEELTLQRWNELFPLVSEDASINSGKRLGLRNLFIKRKTGSSSCRSQSCEQYCGEFDTDVSSVPYDTSSLESDAIHSVKRIGTGKIMVYDIQIERANNFFANKILVHNSLIIDDPIDAKKAFSDIEIANVNDTYDQAVSSRLNDLSKDGIVLIMQRTRTNDLTGHLMSKKEQNWVVFRVAMEAEAIPGYNAMEDLGVNIYDGKCVDDIREEGDLMFPDRFTREAVDALKEDLGEYGTAGQLQQRPTPLGGGIIKKNYWTTWPDDMKFPSMEHVFISWDTAFTDKDNKDASYSAVTRWGVFWHEQQQRHCLMVLGMWYARVAYPDLRNKAQWMTEEYSPDCHLIEKKASGQSLIQDLRRTGSGARRVRLRAVMPDRDKITRAYTATATMASGIVYTPNRKWAKKLIDFCSEFPAGAPPSGDLTDTVTQAILYLTKGWWISHPDDDEPENRMEGVPFGNPDDHDESDIDINLTGGMYG